MKPNDRYSDTRRTFLQLAAMTAGVGASGLSLGQEEEDAGEPGDLLEGVPVAGDFPEGPTVGLQKFAEGLPAPTSVEQFEGDEEGRHYIVTQTGQIYVHSPAGGDATETPTEDGQAGDGEEGTPAGQPADEIRLEGYTEGWVGAAPEEIADRENPTLRLVAGETYTITWENADGQPHNIVLLDDGGNILERTEIVSEEGATQSLEFEATEEMDQYVCEVHQGTMVGRVSVTSEATDGTDQPGEVATPAEMDLFLDIEDRLISLGIGRLGNYDERGLLDMAFHPDFAENRKFYVRYSAPERHGRGFDHTDVLAEFEASEDFESADPDSERTIMEVPQPQDNHNGGKLAFGDDGYLYTSVGDGGNVHDVGLGHVEDWYEENEGGNGQDTEQNLLGGIHRIEVDPESDEEAGGPAEGAYEIPDDNPLVDEEGQLGEYYAWGFRNPWGMSLDEEGNLFVSDAGQHRIESLYDVEAGGNYSWNVKEGSFCFSPETPLESPADCPDETPADVRGGEPLRDPIAEYSHRRYTEAFIDSSVVTGGQRYVGEAIPELQGNFVFGNWSSEGVAAADGEVLVAVDPAGDGNAGEETADEVGTDETAAGNQTTAENDTVADGADNETTVDDETTAGNETVAGNETTAGNETGVDAEEDGTPTATDERWELEELVFEGTEGGSLDRYVYGVERDPEGELYVLANTDFRPFPETGEIYRIVPAEEGEEVPPPEDPATVDPEAEQERDAEENTTAPEGS